MVGGIVLAAIGILYLVKPDIFKRWSQKRTSTTQHGMSPKGYVLYMRILGVVFIVVGAWLVYASR